MSLVEQHCLADHGHVLRLGSDSERLAHIMSIFRAALADLYFDEFMVEERLLQSSDHAIRDAFFSHGDDGLKMMSQRLEVTALGGAKLVVGHDRPRLASDPKSCQPPDCRGVAIAVQVRQIHGRGLLVVRNNKEFPWYGGG
jgi:hypothetical protein